jgi:hypothetical protein
VTEAEGGTVSKAITAVSDALRRMPPAFTVLVALNVAFLGADLFYRLAQQTDRTELLKQVLENCVKR